MQRRGAGWLWTRFAADSIPIQGMVAVATGLRQHSVALGVGLYAGLGGGSDGLESRSTRLFGWWLQMRCSWADGRVVAVDG